MINKINNKKIILIIISIIFIIILFVFFNNGQKEGEEIIEEIDNKEDINIQENEEETKQIVIHITGCVKQQGIIKINEGARIADVIQLAGGLTEEADIAKVNLAYIIKDAQKIYIPSIYDEPDIEYITSKSGENVIIENKYEGESNMVNINTSTQTELEKLPGIGPSTALKIINYREEKGKFKSIEEIKEVPGIGDAKFNSIKDMIEI